MLPDMSRPWPIRVCLVAGPVLLIGIATVLALARWRAGWLIRPLPGPLVVTAAPALPRLTSEDLDRWQEDRRSSDLAEAVAVALAAGGARARAGLVALGLAPRLGRDPGVDRGLVALANSGDLALRRAARQARRPGPLTEWVRAGVAAGGRTSTTPWWGGGDAIDAPAWDAFALELYRSAGYIFRMPAWCRTDVDRLVDAIAARQTPEGALDPRIEVHLLQMQALALDFGCLTSPRSQAVLERAWRWFHTQADRCRWEYDTSAAYLAAKTVRTTCFPAGLALPAIIVDPPPDPASVTYMVRGRPLPAFNDEARILALAARTWGPHATTIASDLAGLAPRTLVARQALTLATMAVGFDQARVRERVETLRDAMIVSSDGLDGTWAGDADNDPVCTTIAALHELMNRRRWVAP